MSSKDSETPVAAPAAGNQLKLVTILAGGAFVLSLASTVISALLLMRPLADKIEQGNGEVKEAVEASGQAVNKSMNAMRDACIDWQAVLKSVNDKPDAMFRITKAPDGFLTLSEVKAAAGDVTPVPDSKH